MTTISSATRSVEIAPGRPTVVIGERLNPTGRPRLAEALAQGDLELLVSEAVRQVAAGADIIDVNVGIAEGDEPALLRAAVSRLTQAVEVPLCLDSSNPEALEAGLAVYPGKALVNSVTGAVASLEAVLPLVKRHRAAVIGLPLDEQGIPAEAEPRLHIAQHIMEAAARLGIPADDVIIDCLATAAAVEPAATQVTLETIRRVSRELGSNTVVGASNISFGLPRRRALNASFLSLAIGAGATCAIADPTDPSAMQAIVATDLLMGRDEYARRYLAHYRSSRSA